MSAGVQSICHLRFDTHQLVTEFPPRISNVNKLVVYGIACPPGSIHSGQIVFSRWKGTSLPASLEFNGFRTRFEFREDYFGYEPRPAGPAVTEWYLNFAHSELFGFYGGPLFAQDEMQVAEHPALGSLREALLVSDTKPLTVERGVPTPALIRGVERRCKVALDANIRLGRSKGLYGNNFARASAETVARATLALIPPTVSNLLAMEAPPGGRGRYTRGEIEYVLSTAYTGFAAARLESCLEAPEPPEVVLHTGFWGCGAYGGDQVLMALLQLIAAGMAGLDRLVFHTGSSVGSHAFVKARQTLRQVLQTARQHAGSQGWAVSDLISYLESMEFEWGMSDGN